MLTAFDFCHPATLQEVLGDWELGLQTVAVVSLDCYNSSLYLVDHHADYFCLLIVSQDGPVIETVLI